MGEQQKSEIFEVRDIRNKGIFVIEDSFFNGYAKVLGSYILTVYICLCRHADKQQQCWPSQQKIAEELGMSEPTVNEALKVLEYFGLIKKQRIGKGCTNRYWLLDKKYWKKDFEVTLNSLRTGDLKEFKDTTKGLLVGNLNSLSSNSKETHSKDNTTYTSSELHQEIIEYFITSVREKKNFKYTVNGGKDGQAVKRYQNIKTAPPYREIIDFYLQDRKSDEHPSISAALSIDTINKFNLKQQKESWRYGK